MKIYVGNLSCEVTENQIHDLFAQHGQVQDAYIIKERGTEKSRGFAFVMMPDGVEAKAAITALKGHEFEGQLLTVSEAKSKGTGIKPQPDRRINRPRYTARSGNARNRHTPR